jgi:signal transduction histidine kinase/ligand-binding sensor domain-containing protein
MTRLLVVLALATSGSAADLSWSVRTWQMDDGSNNSISGIAQSPDGYLWIATLAGLNQFDGLHFEHHVVGALYDAPDANVRGMLASRDGGLWVVLDGSVVYLKRNAAPIVIRDNIPSLKLICMVEDDHGTLWIGYHPNVVCRIKDAKATILGNDAGIPNGSTISLATDSKEQLWLASGNHIGLFIDGHFSEVVDAPDASSLARSGKGGLWVCSGLTLYKFDGTGPLQLLETLPLPRRGHNRISLLFEDRRGTLWIGTSADGLFRYDDQGFQKVITPQARFSCMAEDREGNLWTGTDAGVNRITPRAVEVEGADPQSPRPFVDSICQGRDSKIWAAMANGDLMVRDDARWTPAPFKFSGDALCVAPDPDGAIWLGTNSRELYRWKSGVLTRWDANRGLVGRYIYSLLPTADGDLWIAAIVPDAVMRLHNGHLINYELPSGVHRIDVIAQDHDGNVWMGWVATGSETGGLLKIVGDQIIDQRTLAGTNRPVQTLFVTKDNTLLIGYRTGQLGWFKNGRFGSITTKQGLYDDNIAQIVADDRGWLWFGSSRGIFKLRQSELKDFIDGKINQVQPVIYGPDEGLPPLQATRGMSSAVRTQDGRIWMAMATGLAIVHPDRVREQLAPPHVQIQRALVDDQIVASSGDYFAKNATNVDNQSGFVLHLPPDYHRLEFDFTALTFSSPENARFRYRLVGFDENWNETSEPREAIYPRLPNGNYVFRVVGCSADGIWSQQEAQMAIAVAPFVWQTWWFQTGSLAIFGFVVLVLVRYLAFRRLRRRLEIAEHRGTLDRERARIARDIHDDLGHGLTQIVLLSELTLLDHFSQYERDDQLGQIVSTAKQGLRSLDETVWAINPRNDTLPDLVDYIGHFVMKSLATANIKCRLDLPDYPPNLVVPAEVRHCLFLVVKEAVHNIISHANAKSVNMTIKVTGDALGIAIEDDGQGFAFGEISSGQDGLLNMRQRMADIGGTFEIQSGMGVGTCISLRYEWRPQARVGQSRAEN